MISDRKVLCASSRLHTDKNPLIFDQKFLNKVVWFGGKDMDELSHCISSLCCVTLVRENLKVLHPGIISFQCCQFRSICLKMMLPVTSRKERAVGDSVPTAVVELGAVRSLSGSRRGG